MLAGNSDLYLLLLTVCSIATSQCVTSFSGFYSPENGPAPWSPATTGGIAHDMGPSALFYTAPQNQPAIIDPFVRQQLLSFALFGGGPRYSAPWAMYHSYPVGGQQTWMPVGVSTVGINSLGQSSTKSLPSATLVQDAFGFYHQVLSPAAIPVSSNSKKFQVHSISSKPCPARPVAVLPPSTIANPEQISATAIEDAAHNHQKIATATPSNPVETLPQSQPFVTEAEITITTTGAPLYVPNMAPIIGFQQQNTDADSAKPTAPHEDAKINVVPPTGFPPSCPLIGPDGLEYCLYTDLSQNLPQALSYCTEQGMQLARMTSKNSEFLNRIVDTTFPNTSFSCLEKLTMLGNFDVSMRYGSYAYTLGQQCQQASGNNTDSSSPYDICLRYEDCTLVDWLTPRPFFCARLKDTDQKSETSDEKFVDLRKFHTIGQWDYYVSIMPINKYLESVKLTAEQPSTSLSPPFVPLDPTCVPAKAGQLPSEVLETLKNDAKMPRKFSVLTQSFNPNGFNRKCVPNCKDDEAQSMLYVVCAKDSQLETEGNTTKHRYAQLWTKNSIFYNISDQFNSTERQQIVDALLTVSHVSCVRFEPLPTSSRGDLTDFISFEPIASPNTCQSLDYGRRVGGGAHVIVLAPECFTRVGHLLRQVLHTLGVPPEHIRFDRDKYIRIHNENVQQNPAIQRYFQKQLLPTVITTRGIPYDFDSVTQWTPEAYAKQTGLKTIEAVGHSASTFGQRERLSQRDITKLDILYGTQCNSVVSRAIWPKGFS